MIKRELYMQKIRPFINTNVVKIFTGIRRCGKSVMMSLVQEELLNKGVEQKQILSLNFESDNDDRVKSFDNVIDAVKKIAKQNKRKKLYLFFDEIQELDGWEKLINSFLVDYNSDIYITGSNSKLLSGELATYLAGRYVKIEMYPFSFAEVVQLLKEKNTTLTINEIFNEYLVRGGFPFLYNYDFLEQDANQYISDVFDSIILKDISARNKIRDIAQLKQLLLFFVANTGNTFSATSIVNYLKNEKRNISTETLYNYIDYAKSACLLNLVQRNDLIGKSILSTQSKIYLTDHGIRQAIYGNNLRDINQTLENIVYMELLRRGYEVTIGKIKNKEVDFCAKKQGKIIYIQVAYLLATDETVEREFSVLEQIPDNFPKYVLSMDEIDRSRNGIIHKNVCDWLLGKRKNNYAD